MKHIYALDERMWALITSEDIELKKDTYVFNQDFINASNIDRLINYDFWIIKKGYPKEVFQCTLIKNENGLYFDNIPLEKVRSFIFKGDDETEEDITLPRFLFVRC